MTGLALVVTHHLRPGHEDAFDDLVARTLERITALEPGTLVYAVHTAAGEPLERVFYELYRDHAAFEAHEAYPHLREFLAERLAHIESVDVTFLDVQSLKGPSLSTP
ncbi:MAG TPA: antibiotic biosynthesis monooxygenase [Cellulomonadaceae bacterium]|nr:antibiotic biosynthesis monooxygenase [Cellulomonadaceae bacterium]